MSEEREYGLEDGYSDGVAADAPTVDLGITEGSEYELAYIEGYNRAVAERADQGPEQT